MASARQSCPIFCKNRMVASVFICKLATSMTDTSEEFIPTRSSLLNRLKDLDDQDSWRDFYNTYCRLIFSVALKSGLSKTEAEEVLRKPSSRLPER